MNNGSRRWVSLHEEVKFVPIQKFPSTALVKPFEKDTCGREDEPGEAAFI
jgi:hypothetical protein